MICPLNVFIIRDTRPSLASDACLYNRVPILWLTQRLIFWDTNVILSVRQSHNLIPNIDAVCLVFALVCEYIFPHYQNSHLTLPAFKVIGNVWKLPTLNMCSFSPPAYEVREKVMFIFGNLCLSTGGHPISIPEYFHWYQVPSLEGGGLPHPVPHGGSTPSRTGWGYPHPSGTGWATPLNLGLDGGTPPLSGTK